MAHKAPQYQQDAVMDSLGWRHPKTGELLVARRFSNAEIAEFYRAKKAGYEVIQDDDASKLAELNATPIGARVSDVADELTPIRGFPAHIHFAGGNDPDGTGLDADAVAGDDAGGIHDAELDGLHLDAFAPPAVSMASLEEQTKDDIAEWALTTHGLKVSVNKSKEKMIAQIETYLDSDK